MPHVKQVPMQLTHRWYGRVQKSDSQRLLTVGAATARIYASNGCFHKPRRSQFDPLQPQTLAKRASAMCPKPKFNSTVDGRHSSGISQLSCGIAWTSLSRRAVKGLVRLKSLA